MSMSVSFSSTPPVQPARGVRRDDDDRAAERAAQAKRDDQAREAAKSNADPDRTRGRFVDITA